MTGARPEAFKTELGSVSIPTLEAVKAMMPEKDWNTINDDWAEHDLCFGAQSSRGRLFQDLLAQRYGVSANLAEFVRKSQLACYESYRAMYEGRFAHLFSPCTGVLTWMSNPSQPSFVWQYYSYDLEPLASLYGTQKACEPIHVMMNQSTFNLMVVNNTPAPLAGLTARVRVFNLDGAMKSDHTVNLTAPASAVTDVGAIDFPEVLSPVHFVKLELRDAAGKIVSDNFYWRALPTNSVDYTSLDKIATAQLDAKISRHDADGKCLLDVTLSNPTPVIAVMAHIQLRRADTGARVLPVYYSENFVSLLPGESRTITVETGAKNLGGAQPLVMLDGWNVTVKNQTFPGASIALNTDAQPGGEPRGVIGDPTAIRTIGGRRGGAPAP
jgi:beta-mannosidase